MNARSHSNLPDDRLAWLWLLAGAAFLPFVQFQTVIPLAAWLAPVFLLRFARTRRARIALPALALAHYVSGVIALRGVLPQPMPFLFGLAGTVGMLAYAADMVLARRLNGLSRTLVFPAAIVALDWLFGLSDLGTLGSAAYSQYGNLPLSQLASLFGIWGLGFLIAWLASAINEFWETGRQGLRTGIVPYAVALSLALAYGSARLAFHQSEAPAVRVAALAADRALWHAINAPLRDLAQASLEERATIRPQYAAITDELFARTRQQARAGAKIVVWSEAAAFVLKEDEAALIAQAQTLAREEGIYLEMGLVSVLQSDAFPYGENRAVMITPAGEVAWDYYKTIHPLGDAQFFAPGPGILPVLDTPYGRLASAICFDGDFPALMRQAGQARADILLIPANDWQPIDVMHARVASFRAIETGASLVRATGNGLSLAVDPFGQQLAAADYFAADRLTMTAEVPTRGVWTAQALIGDGLAHASLLGLAGLFAGGFAGRRVSTAGEQPAEATRPAISAAMRRD